MNPLKNDIDLIEDFHDGKLTKEELVSFNERLLTDREFARLFKERKALSKLWQQASQYEGLKSKFNQISKEKKKKNNFTFLISLAATVLVLISITLVIYFSYNKRTDIHYSKNKNVITDSVKEKDSVVLEPYYLPLDSKAKVDSVADNDSIETNRDLKR